MVRDAVSTTRALVAVSANGAPSVAHIRGRWVAFISIRIANPAQKKHAQERMQGWINDFQALAVGK